MIFPNLNFKYIEILVLLKVLLKKLQKASKQPKLIPTRIL